MKRDKLRHAISISNTMATDDKSLTSKATTGSPYQLNADQVSKASSALVKHIQSHVKEREQKADKKNLLADEDASGEEGEENEIPIYLQLGTKKHIQEQNRLKPSKMFAARLFLLIQS